MFRNVPSNDVATVTLLLGRIFYYIVPVPAGVPCSVSLTVGNNRCLQFKKYSTDRELTVTVSIALIKVYGKECTTLYPTTVRLHEISLNSYIKRHFAFMLPYNCGQINGFFVGLLCVSCFAS
jgi:energy-converting hydrogenase Eha subunit B